MLISSEFDHWLTNTLMIPSQNSLMGIFVHVICKTAFAASSYEAGCGSAVKMKDERMCSCADAKLVAVVYFAYVLVDSSRYTAFVVKRHLLADKGGSRGEVQYVAHETSVLCSAKPLRDSDDWPICNTSLCTCTDYETCSHVQECSPKQKN